VHAENGTSIKLTITTDLGGSWLLNRVDAKWKVEKSYTKNTSAEISIDPDIAWKLFSKSLRPHEIKNKITITGDQQLGEVALTMVSVMA